MVNYKSSLLFSGLLATALLSCNPQASAPATDVTTETSVASRKALPFDNEVDSLLALMTLEEKAGQLNFLVGDLFNTGPTVNTSNSKRFDGLIKEGKLTGLFNIHGADYTGRLQKIAVEESRMGIPLIFGADVIHGFKTVFPIPLGSAASWDMQAIEAAERVAAEEATAVGITFNFAPMVDVARDARWGRVAEGAGEDPYLGGLVAQARIRGFQGDDLNKENTLAACAKHFAAYGAPVGGRDYNTVDMSVQSLKETYLVPYKASVDAGVATFMTSFNELNGVPASGSKWLLQDILRRQWGFTGMVVSDWQSIGEMILHGYSADSAQAAIQSLEAGCDMDMMAEIYLRKVPELIRQGKLEQKYLDEAVRNVLRLKYQLGLFEDPYRYSQISREQQEVLTEENRAIARDVAKKSIVLLKNENNLLPLKASGQKIAVIGPLADAASDMNGTWSFFGEPQHAVTILKGIQDRVGAENVLHHKGVNLYDDSLQHISKAVEVATQADIVLLVVGESAVMNGEAASRSNIGLPGVQQQLAEAIHKTGKPTIVILQNGRPLAISWLDENMPAILETWTLGSESGNAIADVIFGDYNPSGKLPMTFPRNVGQVPIYYSYKQTGRMYEGDYSEPRSERVYRSKYRDVENGPLYPFGYGLSYTTFSISEPQLSSSSITMNGELKVKVMVKNTGKVAGKETVQLYLRDRVGSITRPVKELKAFKQLELAPDQSQEVSFTLTQEELSFWRADGSWGAEPGEFTVMVGPDSDNVKQASFTLTTSEM